MKYKVKIKRFVSPYLKRPFNKFSDVDTYGDKPFYSFMDYHLLNNNTISDNTDYDNVITSISNNARYQFRRFKIHPDDTPLSEVKYRNKFKYKLSRIKGIRK